MLTSAWVSHQYLLGGRPSAARGWLARAERGLEDRQCEGRGWVAVERAREGQSIDECAAHARRALEIAREHGAGDLEVFALSLLGQAEVRAGRVVEGMGLLEEAMASASAGQVRNIHTLAEAYCNLIAACTGAGGVVATAFAEKAVEGSLTGRDALLDLTEEPKRLAEPIVRVGGLLLLAQRSFEGVSRCFPLSAFQKLDRLHRRDHPTIART